MSRQTSKRKEILEKYDIPEDAVPQHVAIIMDGNGRWARQRGFGRIKGHREAVKSVRAAVQACCDLEIKYLTLFAFSADNWKRPKDEVDSLMDLLVTFLRKERKNIVKNKIRFMVVGDVKKLPQVAKEEIAKSIEATEKFEGHNFILALNYGGRSDILHGVKECVKKCASGKLDPAKITEEDFSSCLYTRGIPDPDLLISTSGERRISNFFLWQISYTELYISPVLWPDFREKDLIEAVVDYSKRERRFGGVLNE